MPSQSTLLGAAGEHYVLSQLLRRGYVAALAPQGVPNADIVVTDLEGQRLAAIQVKTRRDIGSDRGWHMKAKHESLSSEFLFYCFVDFGKQVSDHATAFILPSAIVSRVLRESHQAWLRKPGKKGQPHNDGDLRRFKPDYSSTFDPEATIYRDGWLERYREKWDLLGPPTRSPLGTAS